MNDLNGFRIPIHRALTQPVLMGGVPKVFLALNLSVAVISVFALKSFWTLPLFMGSHAVAKFLSKRDPYFMDSLIRHINLKPYYHV